MYARSYSLWFGVWLTACASDSLPAAVSSPQTGPANASPARAEAGGTRVPNAGMSGQAIAGTPAPAQQGSAPPSQPAGAGVAAAAVSGGQMARPVAGATAAQGIAGARAAAGSGGKPTASGAGASAGSAATHGQAGAAGTRAAQPTPLYRVPLRVHVQASKLTDAELGPIFSELNSIWQEQAGVCFEIEVTSSEDNRTDGFDFRYTSGRIPGASSANGLTENAHSIWSIDHPQLNAAPHPVMYPTARTTAHELGHALGLAHENPPPSTDCETPCHCAERGENCDDYLLRSGTKGFFLSPPEIQSARQRAARAGASSDAAKSCSAPVFMR